MIYWMHVPTANTVAYPTANISSKAASTTATAGSSGLLNSSHVTIKSIQAGSAHTLGTLSIKSHDGVTTYRTIATPNAATSNMRVNAGVLEFDIPGGGFQAIRDGVGVCDLFIQFTYENKWS